LVQGSSLSSMTLCKQREKEGGRQVQCRQRGGENSGRWLWQTGSVVLFPFIFISVRKLSRPFLSGGVGDSRCLSRRGGGGWGHQLGQVLFVAQSTYSVPGPRLALQCRASLLEVEPPLDSTCRGSHLSSHRAGPRGTSLLLDGDHVAHDGRVRRAML
jgi:hypothetical protein